MRDTEHVAQGLSPESVAGFLLRLALGVLFLFAAVGKFLGPGPIGFAKWILQEFDGTYLPRALVLPYAFTLPYIEFLLGLVLILGLFTRASLFLAGMLLISACWSSRMNRCLRRLSRIVKK